MHAYADWPQTRTHMAKQPLVLLLSPSRGRWSKRCDLTQSAITPSCEKASSNAFANAKLLPASICYDGPPHGWMGTSVPENRYRMQPTRVSMRSHAQRAMPRPKRVAMLWQKGQCVVMCMRGGGGQQGGTITGRRSSQRSAHPPNTMAKQSRRSPSALHDAASPGQHRTNQHKEHLAAIPYPCLLDQFQDEQVQDAQALCQGRPPHQGIPQGGAGLGCSLRGVPRNCSPPCKSSARSLDRVANATHANM